MSHPYQKYIPQVRWEEGVCPCSWQFIPLKEYSLCGMNCEKARGRISSMREIKMSFLEPFWQILRSVPRSIWDNYLSGTCCKLGTTRLLWPHSVSQRGESQHSHPGKISEGLTKHSEKTDTFLTLKLDTFLTLITKWRMLKAKIIKVTIFRYD